MAKTIADVVLDASLNYVKTNGTRLCVCSSQPATYTEAITTYKLAIKTIASGDYTGPADDTSGRKLTTNQEAAITVDATGNAQYVAICDATNTALLLVTTCTPQQLTAGNTVTVPAWKYNPQDPT